MIYQVTGFFFSFINFFKDRRLINTYFCHLFFSMDNFLRALFTVVIDSSWFWKQSIDLRALVFLYLTQSVAQKPVHWRHSSWRIMICLKAWLRTPTGTTFYNCRMSKVEVIVQNINCGFLPWNWAELLLVISVYLVIIAEGLREFSLQHDLKIEIKVWQDKDCRSGAEISNNKLCRY